MVMLRNGHQFHSTRRPGHPAPTNEPYRPTGGGDFGCVRCGAWTTGVLSAEKADEKMGPRPARRPDDAPDACVCHRDGTCACEETSDGVGTACSRCGVREEHCDCGCTCSRGGGESRS